MKKIKVYSKSFDAQIALANKKDPANWQIAKTSNGWFIVIPKTKTPAFFGFL